MSEKFTGSVTELDDFAQARLGQMLREWFLKADVPRAGVVSRDEVLQVLRHGGEFDIDGPKLNHLIKHGIYVPPADNRWSVIDIINLASILDFRQQWLPGAHTAKKSILRQAWEEAAQTGRRGAIIGDLENHTDIRHALLMLISADTPENKGLAFETLWSLLDHKGLL